MKNSRAPSYRVGQRLGRYRIDALLGVGGMSTVYLAKDRLLRRTVAIKVLDQAGAQARRSLEHEAKLLNSLRHPAICRVHAIGSDAGRPFIVMEHVAGVPLSMLMQSGRLPVDRAMRYVRQIVHAVAFAHGRGVVHSDLKSANIMIAFGQEVKIIDFGIAVRRSIECDGSSDDFETTSSTGHPGAGTVPYMAPEILQGGTADSRSDVWALGVLMYEMFSGNRPFMGRTRYEIAAAILTEAPPPLSDSIPAAVNRVVARCLEKTAGRRYSSGRQLAAALGRAASLSTAIGAPLLTGIPRIGPSIRP